MLMFLNFKFLGMLLLFLLVLLLGREVATAQTQEAPQFNAVPRGTSAGETGRVCFYELTANGENAICIKASDTLAADSELTLPWSGVGSSPFIIIEETDGLEAELHLKGYGNQPNAIIRGFQAGGNIGAETAAQIGNLLALEGFGWSTAFDAAPNVAIYLQAVENFTASAKGTSIDFRTTPLGGTTPVVNVTLGPDGVLSTKDILADGQINPFVDSTHDIGDNVTRFTRGHADIWNAEFFEITNAAHGALWTIRQNSGDNTILEFFDTTNVIMSLNASGPAMLVRGHIYPKADQTYILGADILNTNLMWLNVISETLQAGRSNISDPGVVTPVQGKIHLNNSNATSTASGDMQGVWDTSMSLALIEVGNMRIAAGGNFFDRVITGDASCGSIDDGWTAFQSTSEEQHTCSGGVTRLFPSTTISFAPKTLNCANNQTALDPRWDNGILVESDGCSSTLLFAGGVDISSDTNLSALSPVTLVGDQIRCTTCVTSGVQTIAGAKTFSSTAAFTAGLGTSSGTNSVIYVGTSGEFYNRTQSGDLSCGGVGDGFTIMQSTDKEIQVCIGGTMYAGALI